MQSDIADVGDLSEVHAILAAGGLTCYKDIFRRSNIYLF